MRFTYTHMWYTRIYIMLYGAVIAANIYIYIRTWGGLQMEADLQVDVVKSRLSCVWGGGANRVGRAQSGPGLYPPAPLMACILLWPSVNFSSSSCTRPFHDGSVSEPFEAVGRQGCPRIPLICQ